MKTALMIPSLLATLTTVLAFPTTRQTPNPAHSLARRDVNFPEGCDVVCNWDLSRPELPECTWQICMDNIKKTTCDQTEIASVDNSDAARWNSVYSMFLFENLGAAAPFWNSITKKRDAESGDWRSVNANTLGTLKDFINGMVTGSLTLAKDLTAAQSENAVDREISKLLGAMIGAYSEVIDGTAKTIFNGELSSTQWLYRMFQDGKFISSIDLTISTEEIKRMVAKPIYAQMIPRAWRMSNLPVGPFILDTGLECNDDGSFKNLDDMQRTQVSQDTLAKNGHCDDGKIYILTSTPDHKKHCQQTGDDGSCFADFQQLPGADKLDGKAWAGLTPKDITRAAVNTWKANGKSNNGKTLNVDTEFTNLAKSYGYLESDDIVDRILDSGIHTAGLVMLPVCDGYDARANWARAYNTMGGNFHPWDKYPCNP